MEHGEIRRKLSAYLDNAVGTDEKEEIKRHLGRCGNCRESLAGLELTIERLKSLPQVEPPPWLTGKIMAYVRGAAAPQPGLRLRLFFPLRVKLPLGALALLFLGVTGYYLARTTGPEPPQTAPAPAAREETPPPAAAPPQLPAPQAVPAGAPAPAPSAAPGPPAALPAQKTKAPAAPLPSPAPATPMPPPELQAADEEFVVGGDALLPERFVITPQKMSTANEAPPATAPAGRVEVTLGVDDPAAAAGAIEEAVTRHGGRISGHAYGGESHLLLVRIEAQRLQRLLDRLGRIGTMPERPQVPARGSEIVELAIRW